VSTGPAAGSIARLMRTKTVAGLQFRRALATTLVAGPQPLVSAVTLR
jgi:hypothetical protein